MTLRDKILEPYLDGPKKELFKIYHQIYNKKYDLNSEEGIRRYRIFKDSLKYIKQENAKGHSHKLGITPFADLTDEEYEAKFARPVDLLKKEITEFTKNSSPFLSVEEFNNRQGDTKIDWTSNVSYIKNQGECGSCWAFSGTSAIEINYNILSGKSVNISTQKLVDCDVNNFGCDTGNPYLGIELELFTGSALEIDYPYKGVKETCKYDSSKGVNFVEKILKCSYKCDMNEWVSLLKQGAITVIVDSRGKDFKLYKSGIIDLTYCRCTTHAVVAVALLNDNGTDYVRILNSWSEDWGEHGFMNVKINPNTKTCYITNDAYLPIVYKNPSPTFKKIPTFYTECDFLGPMISSDKPLRVLNPINLQSIAGRIQSIKTYGYDVYVFDNIWCMGKGLKFTGDEKCISTSLNSDMIAAAKSSKSIGIIAPSDFTKKGCVSLFRDDCFERKRLEYCNDIMQIPNTYISSFHLGEGVKKVIMYTEIDFKGISFEFTSFIGRIEDPKLLGKIQSLKIIK